MGATVSVGDPAGARRRLLDDAVKEAVWCTHKREATQLTEKEKSGIDSSIKSLKCARYAELKVRFTESGAVYFEDLGENASMARRLGPLRLDSGYLGSRWTYFDWHMEMGAGATFSLRCTDREAELDGGALESTTLSESAPLDQLRGRYLEVQLTMLTSPTAPTHQQQRRRPQGEPVLHLRLEYGRGRSEVEIDGLRVRKGAGESYQKLVDSEVLSETSSAEVRFALGGDDHHSAIAREVLLSFGMRLKLWRMLDVNGQGSVSLAELDKLVVDIDRVMKKELEDANCAKPGTPQRPRTATRRRPGTPSRTTKPIDTKLSAQRVLQDEELSEFFRGMNSKPALMRAFKDATEHEGDDGTFEEGDRVIYTLPNSKRTRRGKVAKIDRSEGAVTGYHIMPTDPLSSPTHNSTGQGLDHALTKNVREDLNAYVEFDELGDLLVNIVLYNKLWLVFTSFDIDGDRRINVKEFKEKLEELTNAEMTYSSALSEFQMIDVSKSTGLDSFRHEVGLYQDYVDRMRRARHLPPGGYLLFDEFCFYCLNIITDGDRAKLEELSESFTKKRRKVERKRARAAARKGGVIRSNGGVGDTEWGRQLAEERRREATRRPKGSPTGLEPQASAAWVARMNAELERSSANAGNPDFSKRIPHPHGVTGQNEPDLEEDIFAHAQKEGGDESFYTGHADFGDESMPVQQKSSSSSHRQVAQRNAGRRPTGSANHGKRAPEASQITEHAAEFFETMRSLTPSTSTTYDVVGNDCNSERRVDSRANRSNREGGSHGHDAKASFARGDKVEARYGGKSKYYPGKIARVNADGTYDIKYDDGDSERRVEGRLIRSFESNEDDEEMEFVRGDKVEVRYGGKSKYYPGKIARVNANGTYDVVYDDGDTERRVRPRLIRPQSGRRELDVSEPVGFAHGDKVEARYRGRPTYYPGKIESCNSDGTYAVLYDDGDTENSVRASFIRPCGHASATEEFERGDEIEARYGGKSTYYPGKISRVNQDGSYDINYHDGDRERRVVPSLIRAIPRPEDTTANEGGGERERDVILKLHRILRNAESAGVHPEESFEHFDKDGNGVITRSEFTLAMQELGFGRETDALHGVFDIFDENADSEISYAEFIAFINARAQKETSVDYVVGDQVDVRYGGRPQWYRGRIARVNSNGTYDINYNDGDRERRVRSSLIRPVEDLRRPEEHFAPGCAVEARRNSGLVWYRGRIVALRDDGYDVRFDSDGVVERNIPGSYILNLSWV